MVEKKKVTARPPRLSVEDKEMAFINEGVILDAGIVELPATVYPWEEQGVREDVIKVFNLRICEPYFLKLKYISEKIGKSSNSICVSLIEEYLDKELD